MAVEEFGFKIATAKDLPLSWFELVLRPDKFREHLKTLKDNPNVEPTALQLIVVFLEKAGCIEGQATAAYPTERKKTLVQCALFMASFLRWNLALFEENLPAAVQYSLMSYLQEAYPLSDEGGRGKAATPSGEPAEEAGDATTTAVMAHALYHQWLLRFATRCDLPATPRHGSSAVEVAYASPETIKTLVEAQVLTSLSFLSGIASGGEGEGGLALAEHVRLPRVCVELEVQGGGGGGGGGGNGDVVRLEPPLKEEDRLTRQFFLCQVLYDVGAHYFKLEDFSKALSTFTLCQASLDALKPRPQLLFDHTHLSGYLTACQGVLREGAEHAPLPCQLELLRLKDTEATVDALEDDITKGEIPSSFRRTLQMDVSQSEHAASGDVDPVQQPAAKRQKLDKPVLLPVHERLCICNAVRDVLEGCSAGGGFWRLMQQQPQDPAHLAAVLKLCGQVVEGSGRVSKTELNRLQSFVRRICSGKKAASIAFELLPQATASKLSLTEEVRASLEAENPQIAETTGCRERDSHVVTALNSVAKLEQSVSRCLTVSEVITTTERLFQSAREGEHKDIALKWVGTVQAGYATMDMIPDPLVLTKYNALVHRASHLTQAKMFREAVELLTGALRLLSAKNTSTGAKLLRQQLEQRLLCVKLTETNAQLRSSLVELASPQIQALIRETQNFYHEANNNPSMEQSVVQVAGAFLLNTNQFSFLAATNTRTLQPGKIAPRLATAVESVREGRDLRRANRDFFEAVLSVFQPLNAGGSESEQAERSSKLRSELDVFVSNLCQPTSLSLLLAALVRIWTLLKKIDTEIYCEYNTHWPTAIGNSANISSAHVLRCLNSTLSLMLLAHPTHSTWLLTRADLYCAEQEFGAALLDYLLAGELESCHFENEVPTSIWSNQVCYHMISCCERLALPMHAAILCQLLQPVDYELAFGILKNNASNAVETMFPYFWDMDIIEYLIYTQSKRGDVGKQAAAVKVAGQPDLNSNNSAEVLQRAVQVRRRSFLRHFFKQLTSK